MRNPEEDFFGEDDAVFVPGGNAVEEHSSIQALVGRTDQTSVGPSREGYSNLRGWAERIRLVPLEMEQLPEKSDDDFDPGPRAA